MPVFLILLFLLSVSSQSHAQSRNEYRDVIMHNAVTSVTNGTVLNVHNMNTVRLDVQITGTATVSFTISGAGNFGFQSKQCVASDSNTPVTSTDVSGVFYCNVAGGNVFQAAVTARTSGTITVVGRATTGF